MEDILPHLKEDNDNNPQVNAALESLSKAKPEDSVESVAEALKDCYTHSLHVQRITSVQSKLSSMAFLQTFKTMAELKQKSVTMTHDRACSYCHKRIHNRAFAAFTDGSCAHVQCASGVSESWYIYTYIDTYKTSQQHGTYVQRKREESLWQNINTSDTHNTHTQSLNERERKRKRKSWNIWGGSLRLLVWVFFAPPPPPLCEPRD